MKPVYVLALGLAGPGLGCWREAQAVLTGAARYQEGEWPEFTAELLPANERRRVTPTIRIALKVAQEAQRGADIGPEQMSYVFATSGGDIELIDKICRVLTLPERPVSPTQFHNSVLNAPAGYWAIASGSHTASNTIAAYDGSFVAGLLEAAAATLVDAPHVMLVAYDYPAPEPLAKVAGHYPPFAVAMLLGRDRNGSAAMGIRAELVGEQPVDPMDDAGLESLRVGNPAARSLPLLRALAEGSGSRVVLPYLDGRQLAVTVERW
jgi:hypothetical protein